MTTTITTLLPTGCRLVYLLAGFPEIRQQLPLTCRVADFLVSIDRFLLVSLETLRRLQSRRNLEKPTRRLRGHGKREYGKLVHDHDTNLRCGCCSGRPSPPSGRFIAKTTAACSWTARVPQTMSVLAFALQQWRSFPLRPMGLWSRRKGLLCTMGA